MAKWKDILVGLREGASKGFSVGVVIGGFLGVIPKDKLPQKAWFQNVFKNPYGEWKGVNISSVYNSIAIFGAIGAMAGAVYGMFVPIAQRQKDESQQNEAEFQRRQAMRDAGLNPDAPLPSHSPETPQQKTHTVGMEPKEAHVQGMNAQTSHEEAATRPKETALTR